MFKEYTPFEYLLIATANAFGKDKLTFEDRIDWVCMNGKRLRKLAKSSDCEDPHMAMRNIMEIERCVADPSYQSNIRIDLDGCASGVQCLSVLAGCIVSASRVGLVDPDRRCDVYTDLQGFMNTRLPSDAQIGVNSLFSRDDLKQAFMTHWYGSESIPEEVFGEGSKELTAFYDSLEEMCPGVMELYVDIQEATDSDATEYNWTQLDGFEVRTPVVITVDKRVKVDELNSSFTHRTKTIAPKYMYKALLANVTHSTDALLIREVEERVNYSTYHVTKLLKLLKSDKGTAKESFMLRRMIGIAEESKFVSARFMSLVNQKNVKCLPEWIHVALVAMCEEVLRFPPSPMSSVHDALGSLPTSCNGVRFHYAVTLANIAESDAAQFILRRLYNDPGMLFHKSTDGKELARLIRNSNYSLS